MTSAPVYVIAYYPGWPRQFEAERSLLAPILAPWLVGSIEHIGSTAIPGLPGKPVVDIMAGIADLDAARPAIEALRQLQYLHWPYRPETMHWFCKPSDAHRTHHLHLVPYQSPVWIERLAFRDYLRGNPAIAAEYGRLKHRLAKRHRYDREAYTDAKQPFVERVLKLALRRGPSAGVNGYGGSLP